MHAVQVKKFGPQGKRNFEKKFSVMVFVFGINNYLLMKFDCEILRKTMVSGFR